MHGEHRDDPFIENVPGAHGEHIPALRYCPAPQTRDEFEVTGLHITAPASDAVLPAHGMHHDEPLVGLYEFGTQALQEDDPAKE